MTIAKEPYFLNDPDWYEFDEKECRYILKPDAPPEAVKSYQAFYADDGMIIDDFYKDMAQAKKSLDGSQPIPGFWNSPFFIPEPDNWHLTDDAPDELKEEFERYMQP